MSHYSTIKTKIVQRDYLVRALEDMGFKGKVQVHAKPVRLRGYLGDWRRQKAEVVVPRKYVGRASNDLGFRKNQQGTYDAIISNYDRRKYSAKWLGQLTQRYAYHAAVETLRQQGFEVVEETQRSGEIQISLRRTA